MQLKGTGKLDTDGRYLLETGVFENVEDAALDGEIFGDVINTGGTIRPGGADVPGILTIHGINGTYTQSRNGTLAIDLFGPTPGIGYDQLRVTGALALGGHLKLKASSSLSGNSFTLIDNQGSGPVSGTFAGLNEGATVLLGGREFTISYHGGDGNDVVLNAVTPVYVATNTSLVSDPNPSVAGQLVTFTATVTPAAGVGVPTGIVAFNAVSPDGTITITLGTAPLDASGQASFRLPNLPAGSFRIHAAYAGDGDFLPSVSPILVQTVNKADTFTTVSVTPNPAAFGEPLTFTAVVGVLLPGGGPITGTVDFYDTFNGVTTLFAHAVLNGPSEPVSYVFLPGEHIITAVYSGDSNFNGSTSEGVMLTIFDPCEPPVPCSSADAICPALEPAFLATWGS
jgi:hypothetical protein